MYEKESDSFWYEVRKNGKIKYVRRFYDPVTGDLRRVTTTRNKHTKKTEMEAYNFLEERIDNITNQWTPNTNYTFADIAEKWFKIYEHQVKRSTAHNVRGRVNKIIKDIGHIRMSVMTPAIINEYLLRRLTDDGLAYRTVNLDKSLILRILKNALQYGYIEDKNYHVMVEVPQINTKPKDDWKYLEQDELQKIINHFRSTHQHEMERLIILQVNTGMRFNELMAVDYSEDIDFNNQILHIRRNYDPINHIFTTPKTGEARSIYLQNDLIKVIKKQIQCDKIKAIKYNLSRESPTLFRHRLNRPFLLREVNRKLKEVEIEGKKITTHIFRHTFITMMVEKGVDINLIAKHVGHTSTKMIQEVYSHFTDKMDDDLREVIQQSALL